MSAASNDELDEITRAAERLVPELAERLRRHGLGEIEVRRGDLRLRVAGSPERGAAPPEAAAPTAGAGEAAARPGAASVPPSAAQVGVASPAVGFFVYADNLGPGLEVAKGDAIGHVEMLGVRHDVRAPRGGVVRSLVAESGEAVEYGQVVVELEAGPPTP
jgi:acetyl-CoA carboxylase biotin carboxyl carrier protein